MIHIYTVYQYIYYMYMELINLVHYTVYTSPGRHSILYIYIPCILLGNFGAWDNSGCDLVNSTNNYIVCECDHLTNFAILLVCFI